MSVFILERKHPRLCLNGNPKPSCPCGKTDSKGRDSARLEQARALTFSSYKPLSSFLKLKFVYKKLQGD